jgi:hypothetical protein
MGIDLQWTSEHGEILESVADPRALVSKIVDAVPRFEESICARFIDPYGDTIFNRAQITVLKEELQSVPDDALDEEARTHLKQMVELASKAEGQVHTYLKFYGD